MMISYIKLITITDIPALIRKSRVMTCWHILFLSPQKHLLLFTTSQFCECKIKMVFNIFLWAEF